MTNEVKVLITQYVEEKGVLKDDSKKEVVIKAMRPYQFFAITKVLKTLINELNADENINGALVGLFDTVEEDMDTKDLLSALSAQFVKDSAGSIGLLLEVAPESALELISILSDVHPEQLKLQEMDTFFDVVDAIAEVNDLAKVVERVKKSTKSFQKSLKWGEKVTQATLSPVN